MKTNSLHRRLTTKQLLSKYAAGIVLAFAGTCGFALLDNPEKRMVGQLLTIASYMVVAVVGFANLNCEKYSFKCAFRHVLRDDWRAVRFAFLDRYFTRTLLATISSICACLGNISQLQANYELEKPILLHIANPLICVVLFRVIINKYSPHGTSR